MSRRLIGAVILLVASTVVPARAERLNTADIAGTWVGSWQDITFGTSSAFILIISPFGNGGLDFNWHFGTNFFGCGEVGPVHGVVLRGGGKDSVSAHAIRVSSPDDVFGKFTLKTRGTVFKIKGKNACNGLGPKSYRGKGKVVGRDFTAELKAKVDGGTSILKFTLRQVLLS